MRWLPSTSENSTRFLIFHISQSYPNYMILTSNVLKHLLREDLTYHSKLFPEGYCCPRRLQQVREIASVRKSLRHRTQWSQFGWKIHSSSGHPTDMHFKKTIEMQGVGSGILFFRPPLTSHFFVLYLLLVLPISRTRTRNLWKYLRSKTKMGSISLQLMVAEIVRTRNLGEFTHCRGLRSIGSQTSFQFGFHPFARRKFMSILLHATS